MIFTVSSAGCRGCYWHSPTDVRLSFRLTLHFLWAAIVQSVWRLATGWTVRGPNPGGGEIFCTRPDQPWGQPGLLNNGYRVSFPGVRRPGRGVDHPPSSSAGVKGGAIPLFSVWAFKACSRETFTFTYLYLTGLLCVSEFEPLRTKHSVCGIYKVARTSQDMCLHPAGFQVVLCDPLSHF